MFQATLKLLINEFLFQGYRFLKKTPYKYDGQIESTVKKIKKYGFAVFPDFYDSGECENLRNEIDSLILKREKKGSLWSDSLGSDKRCYAAEDDSKLIAKTFDNNFLNNFACNYSKMKMECAFTLASRVKFIEGNLGSGDGWHRDSNHLQFKAIIYLSDVSVNDGPFQILKGSHKFLNKIRHTILIRSNGISTRFNNKCIEKLIKKNPTIYRNFTSKEGTLILVDTSSIHAGMPLNFEGQRYSLTNYYYAPYEDIKTRKKSVLTAAKSQNRI
jgi:hypothetical protein